MIDNEELKEMNTRQLTHIIEDAGDTLANRDNTEPSQKSLAEVVADIGHQIRSIDGGRTTYKEQGSNKEINNGRKER